MTTCRCILIMVFIIAASMPAWCMDQSITSEPYLYPGGFPSADVLHKHEKLVAANGWLSYGMYDRLTITVDWLLVLVGVPAGYVRYQIPGSNNRWSNAIEAYGISFFRFNEPVKTIKVNEFQVWQDGWQGWLHWNSTLAVTKRFRWHAFAGATYDTYQRYEPKNNAQFDHDIIYTNYTYFDAGTGFDFNLKPWLTMNANYIHGNNFYVFDQNPQKWLIQYSFLIAPFLHWKHGFFRNMRIELIGAYVNFPVLKYSLRGSVPLYPLVMWQW